MSPRPTTTCCPSRVVRSHPHPLRCAHGSEIVPPCAERVTHGHDRRSGCVLLHGSGQPVPPTCCSRLRSAICPSRRSHASATLSVPRGRAHCATAGGLLFSASFAGGGGFSSEIGRGIIFSSRSAFQNEAADCVTVVVRFVELEWSPCC